MKSIKSEAGRFWSQMEKLDNSCWNWTGMKYTPAGKIVRGYFHIHGADWAVHRIAWILAHGPIKRNLCVLHHCDNPICCNPDHLFLGTRADNARDMFAKGRQAKKLSDDEVREIRKLASKGISRKEIATKFNIGIGYVGGVINRKYRRYVK